MGAGQRMRAKEAAQSEEFICFLSYNEPVA